VTARRAFFFALARIDRDEYLIQRGGSTKRWLLPREFIYCYQRRRVVAAMFTCLPSLRAR